ncbi:MAG: restriction endonuclease subunit S, partial [Bacteroidetes bacterium]|nr:restriction endonuclease subunit S [Bacteroidota bacterium]
MIKFWIQSDKIRDRVYIPKYYSPQIIRRLDDLASTHDCLMFKDWLADGTIAVGTGDEIGKAAYGTGDIPFVRTSDIVNWEIKTAPKQGVSEEIYKQYAKTQDIQEGDILLVRDGTYLIGANCLVTRFDKQFLYQSHILKLRVKNKKTIDPLLLFLALNTQIVQQQMRSFQFTADIIDTMGRRFFDTIIPIPRDETLRKRLSAQTESALRARMRGKAFIKHCPVLIEEVLRKASLEPLNQFGSADEGAIYGMLQHETVSSEFGGFEYFWLYNDEVRDGIFIPKYYDPLIQDELASLRSSCELCSLGSLRDQKTIEYHTGDEVGKMAYGTGNIPFIRTSDFSNWEVKYNPKQSVS